MKQTTPQKTSVISDNGMRYHKKSAGPAFQLNKNSMNAKSCLYCGKHRNVSDMQTVKLAGKNYHRCKEDCRTKKTSA